MEKEFLTGYPLGHSAEATERHTQAFPERGLLAYLQSCGLEDSLLIRHTSRGQLQSSLETKEVSRNYLHTLPLLHPDH